MQACIHHYSFIRFDKRRIEEDLEVSRRKVSCLQAQIDSSSILEKLQQELKEYREIVKCSICLERPKEVQLPCLFYGSGVTCLLERVTQFTKHSTFVDSGEAISMA